MFGGRDYLDVVPSCFYILLQVSGSIGAFLSLTPLASAIKVEVVSPKLVSVSQFTILRFVNLDPVSQITVLGFVKPEEGSGKQFLRPARSLQEPNNAT